MAEENQSAFKVTDRRLFNADGTMREDAQIPEPTPIAAPPEAPQAFAAAPEPELEPEPDPNEMPEQTMFTEFLMNIASSAFVYLGLVEHPATGRRQVDLRAAKETIDVLVMLHEKTQGNLTRGEARFFEDLLADLQTQFVSMRR
ncbi:MAG TPA: DUF1844 domain-containing protein [Blastocatellia bacterium]|nr:DUF1844 domain-containing protein [Blastocatellia bacterium]HMV82352.1 DUF1844 domain-containing protein [Blastocatellia bacterium]HMY72548.1 DUF1844 domain-containing protein [Blastocatellia bacterium]HNG30339.1 DUF1844 domain-containing protein [Blastocatellia bacterium]